MKGSSVLPTRKVAVVPLQGHLPLVAVKKSATIIIEKTVAPLGEIKWNLVRVDGATMMIAAVQQTGEKMMIAATAG